VESDAPFRTAYESALADLRRGELPRAEGRLRQLLAQRPDDVNALRALGITVGAHGRAAEGLQLLERAVARAPDFAHALADLGAAYRTAGRLDEAAQALARATRLAPALHVAWRRLGDVYVELGREADGNAAYERALATDPARDRFAGAAAALARGDARAAESVYRGRLQEDMNDVGALCGLAAVSLSAGYPRDGERLLRHALRESPHLPLAWRGLAQALLDAGRLDEAEQAALHALRVDARSAAGWVLLGSIRAHRLHGEDAVAAYDRALALEPAQVRVLLSKGHVLKTLGRRAECEQAYRACLALDPTFAEAYCSLADLKNYEFAAADVDAMEQLAARCAEHDPGRAPLEFALGRAYEQRGDYARSFEHYRAGNRARRRRAPFDAAGFEHKCERIARFFDSARFEAYAAAGARDPAPIFVVGLPRSGSTLVEQMLACHADVEGTMELPNLVTIVRELDHAGGRPDAYPESVAALDAAACTVLGERYLRETRAWRGTRPRFVDKMPNNFSHVGLLQLILPRATVIDVRRHPLDACLSAYKQYFAQGQSFTHDLEDLGRYYRAYRELMAHWDRVLPGKVLRVRYETLVTDAEAEVRRLLAHCGLAYDPACLRFHESRRPVRTASSEQVRQPLYDSAIGYWRHYAEQLEPLRRSLGAALDDYADT